MAPSPPVFHFNKPRRITSNRVYLILYSGESYLLNSHGRMKAAPSDQEWTSRLPLKVFYLMAFVNSKSPVELLQLGNLSYFLFP